MYFEYLVLKHTFQSHNASFCRHEPGIYPWISRQAICYLRSWIWRKKIFSPPIQKRNESQHFWWVIWTNQWLRMALLFQNCLLPFFASFFCLVILHFSSYYCSFKYKEFQHTYDIWSEGRQCVADHAGRKVSTNHSDEWVTFFDLCQCQGHLTVCDLILMVNVLCLHPGVVLTIC